MGVSRIDLRWSIGEGSSRVTAGLPERESMLLKERVSVCLGPWLPNNGEEQSKVLGGGDRDGRMCWRMERRTDEVADRWEGCVWATAWADNGTPRGRDKRGVYKHQWNLYDFLVLLITQAGFLKEVTLESRQCLEKRVGRKGRFQSRSGEEHGGGREGGREGRRG